jgi:nicotinamide-nucleotide amidase
MLDEELGNRATALLDLCKSKHLMVVTAESCTGGLVAAALTNIAGSSAVIDRGFVTYTNEAKQEMIGVPASTIDQHGAVSRETAEAMAKGALAHAAADLAVSVTGIAGPSGGTPGKPVGLVHFAAASRGGQLLHEECRFGDVGRTEVRRKAARQAIAMLTKLAEREQPRSPRNS